VGVSQQKGRVEESLRARCGKPIEHNNHRKGKKDGKKTCKPNARKEKTRRGEKGGATTTHSKASGFRARNESHQPGEKKVSEVRGAEAGREGARNGMGVAVPSKKIRTCKGAEGCRTSFSRNRVEQRCGGEKNSPCKVGMKQQER